MEKRETLEKDDEERERSESQAGRQTDAFHSHMMMSCMMMMMMRMPSFLVVSLKSHLQNPSYPSSVVENAYNCFVGVSEFDAGAQRLHKRGILRKKGAETFGEETRTFDRNLFRSLASKAGRWWWL
jgi:hypothetical protein